MDSSLAGKGPHQQNAGVEGATFDSGRNNAACGACEIDSIFFGPAVLS